MLDMNQPVANYLVVALSAVCFMLTYLVGALRSRMNKLEAQAVPVEVKEEETDA
jgi:hypothetical protein